MRSLRDRKLHGGGGRGGAGLPGGGGEARPREKRGGGGGWGEARRDQGEAALGVKARGGGLVAVTGFAGPLRQPP